jgi:hypothetical protein
MNKNRLTRKLVFVKIGANAVVIEDNATVVM